ncbi:hypothetical protein DOK76_12680 [Vagococcus sp. DIV0080]|uniref:Lipoprotein n=1 Tax=Candidatus Vagococcus giribetii TaxID=2230876 RepID=A0ABS3HVY5_9ENTE|nr:hypothetical protein [Vagococcus sp. DIV0080]MBO0477922.1 hypothetical protein [Vagococcus sp. DIV0080]
MFNKKVAIRVISFSLISFMLSGCNASKDNKDGSTQSSLSSVTTKTNIEVNSISFKGSKLTKKDFSSQKAIDATFSIYSELVSSFQESSLIVAENITKAFENSDDKLYEIAKNLTISFESSDIESLEMMPNDDERYIALINLKNSSYGFMDYNVRLYESVMIDGNEATAEELNKPKTLGDLVDMDLEYAKDVGIKYGHTDTSTSDSNTKSTTNSSNEVGSDITKLSKSPTDEQREILLILANQQFKQDFPYKGSKMHSITGVLQDWTQDGESWYYKTTATIVNGNKVKQDRNVEVFITPTSADTGKVEIISY